MLTIETTIAPSNAARSRHVKTDAERRRHRARQQRITVMTN
jgi:hypothetical protein